jgi:hypothetical protein
MTARSRRSLRVLGALLLVSLSISARGTTPIDGCANRATAPALHLPRSPEQLIRAVEWSYDNRSAAAYRTLFTADFLLICADTDSAGNPYRATPWTREDELRFFSDLVAAKRTPPLRELSLDFGPLVVGDDIRPGYYDPSVRKTVTTSFTLRFAEGSDPVRTLTGQLQFFVVRGDSAALPQDLTGSGTSPDSRVWYIQRWEDVTTTGEGWCAFPGRNPLPRR